MPVRGLAGPHVTVDPVHLEPLRLGLRRAGPGALASHRSAALLWGVDVPHLPVHVIVPRTRRPRGDEGLIVHRPSVRLDLGASRRHGMACTNPLRTLVDLGADDPLFVTPALEELVVGGFVSIGAVRATLDRHRRQGHCGIAALEAALDAWPIAGETRPDSRLEIAVARWLNECGFAGFTHHAIVAGFEVDFAFAGPKVVLESDGFEYHSDPHTFTSDRLRDAEIQASGWKVVRLSYRCFHDVGSLVRFERSLRQLLRAG